AVGISAWEAFEKAADPAYHPEQLREGGVDLWQPQRLFVRTRGGTHDVAVPVSDPCPTGRPLQAHEACTDMAVRAAAQHASQGFDKFAPRFRRDTTYFVLLRAAPGAPPLPEGANDLAAGLPPNPYAAEAPAAYVLDSRRLSTRLLLDAAAEVAVPGQAVALTWPRPARPPREAEGADRLWFLVGQADTARLDVSAPTGALTVAPAARPTRPLHRRQYDRFVNHPPYRVENAEGPLGYLDLEIAPPVVVDLDPSPIRLVPGENEVRVRVRTYDPAAERVHLALTLA